MFHGPVSAVNGAVRDISWREIGAVAPLLAGIVFLGVYPRPLLDRVTPSVNHLLAHVQTVDPAAHVPATGQAAITYSVPADQSVDGRAATTGAVLRTGGASRTGATAAGARP